MASWEVWRGALVVVLFALFGTVVVISVMPIPEQTTTEGSEITPAMQAAWEVLSDYGKETLFRRHDKDANLYFNVDEVGANSSGEKFISVCTSTSTCGRDYYFFSPNSRELAEVYGVIRMPKLTDPPETWRSWMDAYQKYLRQ